MIPCSFVYTNYSQTFSDNQFGVEHNKASDVTAFLDIYSVTNMTISRKLGAVLLSLESIFKSGSDDFY